MVDQMARRALALLQLDALPPAASWPGLASAAT